MNRTLIIAEAGVNHNGDINIAKEMVDEAKKAGADIVKFQTFNVEGLVTKNAEMAAYQKENTGVEQTQERMLAQLALSKDEFVELAEYCAKAGIEFLSTPFDIDIIHFLNEIQNLWKVPSGEITNYPYLVEIAKTGKDVILSTGMCTIEEIDAALNVLNSNGTGRVSILHCTTSYPTPMKDVNLKAMITMRNRYKCSVGYSDHTNGIEVPIAAVAMGAEIIEKHFTLDRNMEGPDHKASLEPNELAMMVTSIRNIEKALGNGIKGVSESERANINIARKSIVAKRDIRKGEVFSEENLTTKRPGNGISPMKWPDVIGKKAIHDFRKDDLIEI